MIAVAPLVFLVDDDPSVRRSLTRLLASAGYTVEAFASAKEFLAREPYAGPCCVVLDVRMPGLSGLDLQETLAATERRMSIVFVTGHVDVPMSVRAMKRGAADLLTKPVDDIALITRVKNLARLKMLTDEMLMRATTEEQMGFAATLGINQKQRRRSRPFTRCKTLAFSHRFGSGELQPSA